MVMEELLDKKGHAGCSYCNIGKRLLVEVIRIRKYENRKVQLDCSEIIFVLEGRGRYLFQDFPEYEVVKGEMLFLSAGGSFYFEALSDTMLVVFRFHKTLNLCGRYSIEQLYIPNLNAAAEPDARDIRARTKKLHALEMNPRMWHFLNGIKDSIADGIKCRKHYEVKMQELLYLLRHYYTEEEMHNFFYVILSEDTAFSEYIRLHWQLFKTIGEIAESMQLSQKQFTKRFISIFSKTPQKWITEAKIHRIYKEITQTNKPFKQIASECGLSSEAHFSGFCKKNFNKTPSEIREESVAGV